MKRCLILLFLLITSLGLVSCREDPDRSRTPKKETFDLHATIAFNERSVFLSALAAGADVNRVDKVGDTPLHVAAELGDAYFIQMLLAEGAKPSATDREGRTPRQRAERQVLDSQRLQDYDAAKTFLINAED